MRQWEHSTDGGKTWTPIMPRPRSVIAQLNLEPLETWEDGLGNLYRWRPE